MSEAVLTNELVNQAREGLNRLTQQLNTVVVGKPEPIRMALVALLSEGHVLIEDVPGVGKTLLARAISISIDTPFRRIQFTPDLLPSDILGSSIYSSATSEFLFKPGPIFSNVILADEINRTTPRTQSALLEAMSDALARGHRIELRGFGSFTISHRPPRMGRNPRSGEQVAIPEKRVPHFKPGKALREEVDQRTPKLLEQPPP